MFRITSSEVCHSACSAPSVANILVAVTFELDPNVPHETFDALRDPDFAKEQGRLQYVFVQIRDL